MQRGLRVLFACLLGVAVGIGAFTFVYAKGFSYLSTDPRACANCHVMNTQYDAWLKSGHRHVAGCVDCHLPHSGLEKWITKGKHGFRHSVAFTLQNFKEPIEITPRTARSSRTTACAATRRSSMRSSRARGRPARSSAACIATPGAGHLGAR